jgi:signal peptidase I
MEESESGNKIDNPHNIKKGFFREFIDTALIVVLILVPIRLWIAQPFIVVGSSMYPTFKSGDYLIVDEISYRFEDPKRGDVIIFEPPLKKSEHFIKRVVGMPGESITVVNNKVTIKDTNGKEIILEEPYVSSERDAERSVVLGDDEYFVMGDNRKESADSRIWGPLKKNKIVGRALVRLFPLNRINTFPGVHRYETDEK